MISAACQVKAFAQVVTYIATSRKSFKDSCFAPMTDNEDNNDNLYFAIAWPYLYKGTSQLTSEISLSKGTSCELKFEEVCEVDQSDGGWKDFSSILDLQG